MNKYNAFLKINNKIINKEFLKCTFTYCASFEEIRLRVNY